MVSINLSCFHCASPGPTYLFVIPPECIIYALHVYAVNIAFVCFMTENALKHHSTTYRHSCPYVYSLSALMCLYNYVCGYKNMDFAPCAWLCLYMYAISPFSMMSVADLCVDLSWRRVAQCMAHTSSRRKSLAYYITLGSLKASRFSWGSWGYADDTCEDARNACISRRLSTLEMKFLEFRRGHI